MVGEGAICLPDCGDGAVAGVGYGVVEGAYGFVGEFMVRMLLVFLGDALLSVDVALLQIRPDVGYLHSAVVYVVAGLRGVGVEEGCQLLPRMPEGMEHVSQSYGWLVALSLGFLLEAAGDRVRAHGCEWVGGVLLVVPGAVYGPVVLGPGLLVVQWGHFQRGGKPWSASSGGSGGRLGIVRQMCRGLWPVGPSGSRPYRASAQLMLVESL